MVSNPEDLIRLRDEATSRFVGRGSVVGIGVNSKTQLTFLLSKPDPRQEEAIRLWAGQHSIAADVVVTGTFHTAATALVPNI